MMKKFLSRMLPLFLAMVLLTIPNGIWVNSALIDGGDPNYIYNYEELEAPPLDMALFPKPIKNFDISFIDKSHVRINLETDVPVSLEIKTTQPVQTIL